MLPVFPEVAPVKFLHNLGLYLHIPFCDRKCAYCDFLSMSSDDCVKEKYLTALKKDIEKAVSVLKEKQYYVDTIW